MSLRSEVCHDDGLTTSVRFVPSSRQVFGISETWHVHRRPPLSSLRYLSHRVSARVLGSTAIDLWMLILTPTYLPKYY